MRRVWSVYRRAFVLFCLAILCSGFVGAAPSTDSAGGNSSVVLELPEAQVCWDKLFALSQWNPDRYNEEENPITMILGCAPDDDTNDPELCCQFGMWFAAAGDGRGCFCVESFYLAMVDVVLAAITSSSSAKFDDYDLYLYFDSLCLDLGFPLPVLGNEYCPGGAVQDVNCTASSTDEAEVDALLMTGGNESLLSPFRATWSRNVNVCCWEGLTCDADGRVNGLDQVDGLKVSGTLPAELSLLPKLRSLVFPSSDLQGSLPPEWSALTDLQLLSMPGNRLTGSLPPEYSELRSLQTVLLSENLLSGSLPERYSTIQTPGLQMQLGFNRLTGTLPASWSIMKDTGILDVDSNQLSGTLPDAWSCLTGLILLKLSHNPGLGGTLPAAWSKLHNVNHLSISQGRVTGRLPPQWSTLTGMEYLWLGRQSLSGPLPVQWSAFTKLHRLNLAHNFLTGPLPPEWDTMPIAAMYAQDNWLTGTLPKTEDVRGGPEYGNNKSQILDFHLNFLDQAAGEVGRYADYNCLQGRQQRLCPRPWWPAVQAVLLVLCPLAAALTARGCGANSPHRFTAQGAAGLLRSVYRTGNALPLVAVTAVAQRAFVMSPAFATGVMPSAVAVIRSQGGTVTGEIFRLLSRTVACILLIGPLLAVLVAFLLRLAVLLVPKAGRLAGTSAARAWTLVASEDVLRDNLRVLRLDQLLLMSIFLAGSAMVGAVVYLGLPATITIEDVSSGAFLSLANKKTDQSVPRTELSLLAVSYIYAFYCMVATVMLPAGIIYPSPALKAAVAASSTSHRAGPDLKTLRHLRLAPAVACASFGLFFTSAAVFLWAGLSEGESSARDNLQTALAALVGCQILLVASWTVATWGRHLHCPAWVSRAAARIDPEHSPASLQAPVPHEAWPNASERTTAASRFLSSWSLHSQADPQRRHRSRWRRLLQPRVGLTSQSRARSSALLLVIALQMVYWEGSVAGRALFWLTTVASSAILCWAAVLTDRPTGFEEIFGSEAFGLVVLASDLAQALEADLARGEGDDSDASEDHCPSYFSSASCCASSPGACVRCQLLLKRFPATLFRMEETMCVSYRWQDKVRAVVRPEGHGLYTSHSGVRNQVVGINMSAWQRRELLASLRRGSCTYVWLDVLSIPAALQPEEGTELWQSSEKLMTRMMAVYAAAASTLVLVSEEPDGGRYHQRAWTMQEYCGARSLEVAVQSSVNPKTASVHRPEEQSSSQFFEDMEEDFCSSAVPAEAKRYSEIRRYVDGSQADAVPFWIKSILGPGWSGELLQEVSRKADLFAATMDKVNCSKPVDLVRALVPMLLNTSVQDMAELRQLVGVALSLAEPGSPGAIAMQKAEELLDLEAVPQLPGRAADGWSGSAFQLMPNP